MNTNEHEAPDRNRQIDETDLGPEPDWLLDDPDTTADDVADTREPAAQPAPRREPDPEPTVLAAPDPEPVEASTAVYRATREPIEGEAVTVASSPPMARLRQPRPWLLWSVPLGLVAILAIIAWWGTSRGLNDLTTWSAMRFQHPDLLPARWTMLMWWVVLALVAGFLIYSALPAGRAVTRINRTGPLIAAALISTGVWIFAIHWHWEETALVTMVIAAGALVASYLTVALNPAITRMWQRLFAVIPVSAALGFSVLLLVLSWQSYSTQPFGGRGSSILFLLLLVITAAIFAFFVRDGVISLVFTIWFLGVAQQQWGEDAVISLSAIVAVLLTAATAAMGFILAVESHRPSLTAQVSNRGGRVNFFRKSDNSPSSELPQ